MNVDGALSLINPVSVKENVEVAMMKKAIESTEESGSGMLKLLESAKVEAPHPYLGSKIDFRG